MALKDLLNELNQESVDAVQEQVSGVTVADLIENDSHAQQPADLLEHADKARGIADQLDNLADRADKLADEDEKYSRIAVESAHREFNTIMGAHELSFKANSFESEYTAEGQRQGLVRDARRVAATLRSSADKIDTFSPEGYILDLIIDKKVAIDKAVKILKSEFAAVKARSTVIGQTGIVVNHNGIGRFLTAAGTVITDLPGALKHDIQWLEKSNQWIENRVKTLEDLKDDAEGKAVNVPEDKGTEINKDKKDARSVKAYDLMGNWCVFEFKRFNGVTFVPNDSTFASAFGEGVKLAVKALIGGTLGAAIGFGFGPVGAAVGAAVGYVGTLADQGKHADEAMANKRQIAAAYAVNEMEKFFSDLANIESHLITKETIVRVEALEKRDDATAKTKEFKQAIKDIKNLTEAILSHTFYLSTEGAKLLERIAKESEKLAKR